MDNVVAANVHIEIFLVCIVFRGKHPSSHKLKQEPTQITSATKESLNSQGKKTSSVHILKVFSK